MSETEVGKDEMVATVSTLFAKGIVPRNNWHEFLVQWKRAHAEDDRHMMESLLHRGYKVPLDRHYEYIDRHVFYFLNAHGWADSSLLKLPEDANSWNYGGSVQEMPKEFRQQLARKAFNLLCSNLFKMESKPGQGNENHLFILEQHVASEQLFPIIQEFFGIEKNEFSGRVTIRNLFLYGQEMSHNEQQVEAFLLDLAKFLWKWKEHEIPTWRGKEEQNAEKKWNTDMRFRLDNAKPWMIEILDRLGKLEVLQNWILDLDKACLAKLKEIALRSKFYTGEAYLVTKERPVATIEEACCAGSKAAWFLKKHEVLLREHKRLAAIYNAKRQKEEADRKLNELSGKS